jgi:hypothetical protein
VKTLKQNLLGKRLKEKQKPLFFTKRHQELRQLQLQNNDINVTTNTISNDNGINNDSQEDINDRKQKQKQELLERNR